MVFHPENSDVLAVLDWEMSSIGHPLADLANMTMYWYIPAFGSEFATLECSVATSR